MYSICRIETKFGPVIISENGKAVTSLHFGGSIPLESKTGTSPLLDEAKEQIKAYSAGRLCKFSLPLAPAGSAFFMEVWHALCEIPYGETRSYKEIALMTGRPGASRAVGMACRCNAIGLFIPCHRVIGSNGSLTGFVGGLAVKQALLEHERHALAKSKDDDFSSYNISSL